MLGFSKTKNQMKNLTLILAALASFAQVSTAAPANDNFANAQVLTGTFATGSGDGSGATREIGEPAGGGTNSVWYKWTAPAYGKAEFGALFTASYSYRDIQIFVGTAINNLVEVGAIDDAKEPRDSTLVGKDQTYYIRLSDVTGGAATTFDVWVDLDVTGYNQPLFQSTSWSNDNFSQATQISGSQVKAIGYGASATREAGEPIDTGNKTIWWKWVAPSSGTTIFSSVGSISNFSHTLTVATGSAVGDLSYVSKDGNSGGTGGEIALKTTAGTTYYFCVGTALSSTHAYQVTVSHTIEAATSSGSGTGGRFSTLRRDVLDYTTISGVFTMTGLSGMKVVVPAGFYVRSGSFHPTAKKWSFILDKTSSSVSPTSCKVDIYCYKAGKQVGKFTKTFRVW